MGNYFQKTDDSWIERRITMRDKHLLHMRPLQKLVAFAASLDAQISISSGGTDWNAKSLTDMLFFGGNLVSSDDDTFIIKAKGNDAERALEEIGAMLSGGIFAENEDFIAEKA
jgi:phosphotransferase system HPr (HPr) family protein